LYERVSPEEVLVSVDFFSKFWLISKVSNDLFSAFKKVNIAEFNNKNEMIINTNFF
jgi:hypothetical protein